MKKMGIKTGIQTEIKKINETLLELMIGIILFALLCQVSLVWIVDRKIWYSLGLWIGAVMAVCGAIHMYRGLDMALDCGSEAGKILQKKSLQRYAAFVVCLGLLMVTEAANPLSAFLGLMGLKVAAYIQPFTHKWIHRKKIKKP